MVAVSAVASATRSGLAVSLWLLFWSLQAAALPGCCGDGVSYTMINPWSFFFNLLVQALGDAQ